MNKDRDPNEILTAPAAAAELKINRRTTARWAAEGRVPDVTRKYIVGSLQLTWSAPRSAWMQAAGRKKCG